MANPVIQLCLQPIRDLLIDEGRFLYGVSDEVERVERELKNIHAYLKDADKWPDKNKAAILPDWIDELNELASRAEDVLEKYVIEVKSRRGGNLMKKSRRALCIFSECLTVHRVGEEIKTIRSRLTTLAGRLPFVAPGASSSNPTEDHPQHLLRLTFQHQVKQHFVGMEEDISSLLSLVEDQSKPVISIYGMGGLGKTTLARKIYHHENVIRVFGKARAWICSTEQFQAETVIRQILEQFLPDNENDRISNMNYTQLVRKLRDFLMHKRCLIVIDDIWETNHWSILMNAFPIGEIGQCKVLLTTRQEELAPLGCRHKLNCLTQDQGWELLRKIALPRELESEQRPELETIGRDMVKICDGLPLSITVLGGILCGKQTLSQWQTVSENVVSHLKRGDQKVKQVLDLSYDALPYYLKPCFLYLGSFREDQEIESERLYLLWMADGLISYEEQGRNETLRDVAKRHLIELASRSMVQIRKYNSLTLCGLHDLMRELCLLKGKEKGFLKLVDVCGQTNYDHNNSVASRLAIHYDRDSNDYVKSGS